MKVLRTSAAAPLLLLPSIAVTWMVVMTMPFASAFTTLKAPSAPLSVNRQRKRRTLSLSARRRDQDLEERLWSIRNSWKTNSNSNSDSGSVLQSDVPSDKNGKNNENDIQKLNLAKEFKDRFMKLPPEPEDQFIMTGDICILFLYAFTSHSINDSVVSGLLDDPKMTIPQAIKELDPMHDMISLQHPVWVDLASNPNVPFGNPSVDRALEVSAREAFMNHWGPLLSTEGSACVALCTCWLIAGWFHRAFLFDSTTYCNPDRALTKTVETWLTAALLLAVLATGTDWLVGHVPALQSLFCVTCKSAAAAGGGEFKAAMAETNLPMMVNFWSLTQSDVLFIVDSLTVLIAWRWSAHRILNTFW